MGKCASPISLDEYLHTEYEPACEYVDGLLEDRNAGKSTHGLTQLNVILWLSANVDRDAYEALPGQSVKISPTQVRIPDVCLVPVDDKDEVTQRPPPLWVEILSPEDRWTRIDRKLRDLRAFGVPSIWIIDPYSREAWFASADTPATPVSDGLLRCESLGLELNFIDVLPDE